MSDRDPRSLGSRIALVAGASVAALAAAELVLRVVLPMPSLAAIFAPVDDPALLYEAVPGASHRFEHSVRGGSFVTGPSDVTIGPGGDRAMPPGDPGCPELWLAGDSYAFGWGVSDHQTYAVLLQERATDRLGCRPTVSNLAVGGYHLGQIRRRVEAWIERRQRTPALLAVHVAGNDGLTDINWASPVGIPRALSSRLHMLTIVNIIAVSRQFQAVEEDPTQGDRLSDRMRELTAVTGEHDIPLWLIWQPDVVTGARTPGEAAAVGSVDLTPCNAPRERMHLSEHDDHYSPQGHRCVADLLAPGLLAALGTNR